MYYTTLSRIYHRSDEVYDKVLSTLADHLVPQLQQSINQSAQSIVDSFGSNPSPFALDAARELLLQKLTELLILSAVDDPSECLRPNQLTSAHCHFWFKTE